MICVCLNSGKQPDPDTFIPSYSTVGAAIMHKTGLMLSSWRRRRSRTLLMFKMRNKVRAVYEDIIHIYRTVQKALENLIHQLMEGTSIVPEAKWHPQPIKQPERRDHCSIRNVCSRYGT